MMDRQRRSFGYRWMVGGVTLALGFAFVSACSDETSPDGSDGVAGAGELQEPASGGSGVEASGGAEAAGGSSGGSAGAASGGDTGMAAAGGQPAMAEPCQQLAEPPGDALCALSGDLDAATQLLIQATVLTPDGALQAGEVLVTRPAGADVEGTVECAACDCPSEEASTVTLTCPQAVVSPGLINLLARNRYPQDALAPSDERYDHRTDWRDGVRGHTELSVSSDASVESLAYGELQQLLAGVTSSASGGSVEGLVRNLDASDPEGLPRRVRISTFPLDDTSGALGTTDCVDYPDYDSPNVLNSPSYQPEIARGIDSDARKEFLCLSGLESGGQDLIASKTTVSGGLALGPAEAELIAARSAQVLWTPRSDLRLYGMTAPVTLFHQLGIPLSLGSDWAATGSMTLQEELDCARQFNQEHLAGTFDDEQLWRMVTTHPADAAASAAELGSLDAGKFADLVVVDASGQQGPYAAVVNARSDDVALVLRGSRPLVGRASLIEGLVPASELATCPTLDVCSNSHRVCVERDAGLTLSALQAMAASATPPLAPLAYCGERDEAPTCVPQRDDEDGDGIVYPVDGDQDGDGVLDAADNCPDIFNPPRPVDGFVQGDRDSDALGDACDPSP